MDNATANFTHCSPPSSLINLVLTFVWQPAPFQLPVIGLGSSVATTPKSSHTRCSRKRATHRWSPISMPSHGPIWNSHWSHKKATEQEQSKENIQHEMFQTQVASVYTDVLVGVPFLQPVYQNIAGIHLRWHHFSIGAIDFDPCIETGLVVTLHNVPSISIVCPYSTVVWTLKWGKHGKLVRTKSWSSNFSHCFYKWLVTALSLNILLTINDSS